MAIRVLKFYLTFVVILSFLLFSLFAYSKVVSAMTGFNALIQNAGDSGSSGTLLLSDTIGGTLCQSSANTSGSIVSNSATCSDYPLAQNTGVATGVNISDTGSLTPLSASVSSTGCGVSELADMTNNDNALADGYLNYLQPGPTSLSGSYSIGLNGTNGFGETLSQISSPGPQSFSIAAWFKTSTDGSIVGFTNSQTNSGQSTWDRHLWIDNTGHLVFGLYPNGIYELTSPGTYANNAWHFAVITVTGSTATQGSVYMYVDGNLVAGSNNDETYFGGTQPAQVYGGWWHLGWSNASQYWPDGPTNPYFTGSLGQIAIFGSVLTSGQVSNLYASSTASQYESNVTGGVASSNSYWTLESYNSSTVPCNDIGVTIGDTANGTCVYPVLSSPCPSNAAVGGLDLTENLNSSLGNIVFTAYAYGVVPTNIVNLHATVAWKLQTDYGSFSATLLHDSGFVYI